MQFKLRKEKGRVAGRHIERGPDGKDVVYEAGDTVDSERDLMTIFPGKFERVATREDFADTDPNIVDKRVGVLEDENKELKEKLAALEGAGSNSDKSKKEDPPENDPEDKEDQDDNNDDDDKTEEHPEYGKDVTDEFPTAAKVELKVYTKNNTWFVIVDPEAEEGTDPVENEKKLHRKDVEPFLADYVEDDDDDDDDDED